MCSAILYGGSSPPALRGEPPSVAATGSSASDRAVWGALAAVGDAPPAAVVLGSPGSGGGTTGDASTAAAISLTGGSVSGSTGTAAGGRSRYWGASVTVPPADSSRIAEHLGYKLHRGEHTITMSL